MIGFCIRTEVSFSGAQQFGIALSTIYIYTWCICTSTLCIFTFYIYTYGIADGNAAPTDDKIFGAAVELTVNTMWLGYELKEHLEIQIHQ